MLPPISLFHFLVCYFAYLVDTVIIFVFTVFLIVTNHLRLVFVLVSIASMFT